MKKKNQSTPVENPPAPMTAAATPAPSTAAFADPVEGAFVAPADLGEFAAASSPRAVHAFQGKKLFPYDAGTNLLLGTLGGESVHPEHWIYMLLFLLIDLQEAYDRRRTARTQETPDAAADAAVVDLLAANDANPTKYRVAVLRRVSKLGQKGVAEATALIETILTEFAQSEPQPA